MADSESTPLYDFFLHFHESDQELANGILDFLEDSSNGGYKGFLLDRDGETGTRNHNLNVALHNSRLLLILLSKKALDNRRFMSVLETSFSFYLRKKFDLIPIYVEKIHKPLILRSIYGIDYFSNFFWPKLKNRILRK